MTRWTDEQARVVYGACANRVIFAAPGSGKTAVLTGHIQHLLRTGSLRGRNVTVMTFTRQAAAELYRRVAAERRIVKEELEAVRMGTFHSQVFHALLECRYEVRVPLHASEQTRLMRTALEMCGMTPRPWQVRQALAYVTRCKSEWPPAEPPRRWKRVLAAYESLKRRHNRCDLDDLLLAMCDLLDKHTDGPQMPWLRHQKYILVDEFQDTNAVQWFILFRMSKLSGAKVCVVGDDDQAIYGFRGASPQWLLRFSSHMPGAEQALLSRNFRSRTCIVTHARKLIEHNRQRMDKPMVAVHNEPGICQGLLWPDEETQAEAVCRLLRAGGGSSTAVLARTRQQLVRVVRRLSPLPQRVEFHTLHEAKGREWDVVHIIGAVTNNPYLPVNLSESDREMPDAQGSEEERRLFYVGMTRARHVLYIHVPERCQHETVRPLPYIQESGLLLCRGM
ncbi:MAG: UvrD-helicase domain-containing protein [Alicyclobacillus herbarius]|uniref:ATP-dependent helicase n=1 Tax=Alicyclobacillus herbarius TaxID=122960 RepID=UPI002352D1EA|nr:UvrD-helicase domain-containing protein [Alicyclobacillus herbarius]MCL6631291.1 UvrD-helicase domain-containing protein [Alicyclobacillus herbarius]